MSAGNGSAAGAAPGYLWPWFQRLLGLALIVVTLIALQDLPRAGLAVFVAAAAYLLLLVRVPPLWLVVLPLVCVGLDLAPWTGRFVYNELDGFFWLTIAAALICARYPAPRQWLRERDAGVWLIVAFAALALLGTSGWSAILDPPGRSFSNPYLADFYSYKVGKGLLWGLLLLPLWREHYRADRAAALRWLWLGTALAALALLLVTLWERGTLHAAGEGLLPFIASLTDLTTGYRVIGLFSAMHTGGEVLDGTLLILLVANGYGALYADRRWLRRLCGAAVAACVYVTLVGFTRATYAAIALALVLLVALELYRWHQRAGLSVLRVLLLGSVLPLFFVGSYAAALQGATALLLVTLLQLVLLRAAVRAWLPAAAGRWRAMAMIAVLVPLVFAVGLTAETMAGRMLGVEKDLGKRTTHWARVINAGLDGPRSTLWGQGAGMFPRVYAAAYPGEPYWLGRWEITRDPLPALGLSGGDDLLVSQRISPGEGALRLELRARGAEGAVLDVGLCARNILDTNWYGGRCDRQQLTLTPVWHNYRLTLQQPASTLDGEARGWPRALQLRATRERAVVEVDSIRVIKGLEQPLVNGGFFRGMDGWFFYTDFAHLPFHIKNIWVQFWFDTGWLGLLLMLALVGCACLRALRAPVDEVLVPLGAVAVLSMAALGMFGTPLDSPRISWLYYLLLFAAVLKPPRQSSGTWP